MSSHVFRSARLSGRTATHCNTLQHPATHCNTLQHSATLCSILQRTATQCNELPSRLATMLSHILRSDTPQHSATLCSTLAMGCAGFLRRRETAFRNLASCQMGRFHSIITEKRINFHETIHQFLQNCLDLRTNDYTLLNFVQKIGKFCVLLGLLWRP